MITFFCCFLPNYRSQIHTHLVWGSKKKWRKFRGALFLHFIRFQFCSLSWIKSKKRCGIQVFPPRSFFSSCFNSFCRVFFSSYGLQWWWCVCGVWVWRTYLSREHFFSFRISKFSFLFNFLALFSVFVVVGAATVGYRFRWLACKMSWLLLFFHRIYYFLRIILLDSLVFWCVTSMLVSVWYVRCAHSIFYYCSLFN